MFVVPIVRMEADTLAEAMAAWRAGAITNWEYLLRLNGLGGRSYNDLMQYPVLPWVLADYAARTLDLRDPASFRDLSKPMAVQNKNREQHYINIYNDLKAARREGCSPLLSRQPHHYASLYSNSGGVLHYLVRIPPFTELFLNYQDNNFDMPDRTFHSLATTWRLITNDSPTDVKELIPELFYLPELFHNNEGLNLGTRQCGAAVDDVELPAWAPDARLFTLVHRQALEAAHVTETLPHWIDLVFGYKQTGQPALDALNVFPACTYYGFDPSALEEEVDRTAAAAMVRTYGQAPRQLLRAPHPHAAHDLTQHATDQVPVWAGVVGARWGRYCGSPALGPVCVVWRRSCTGAASLHALPHPRSVAVANRATALLAMHGEAASNTQNNGQQPLALVSWGHSDNIVRLKRRRDVRPDLLLHVCALDQNNGQQPLALVSWGHSDNIVRLKRRRDVRPDLLLHVCALDQNNGQQPLALVSWGHSDNIVRLKRRRDVRPDLLLHVCALDQNNGQQPLALVSWGHSDNIVRLKRRRDVRPDLLLHVCALDQNNGQQPLALVSWGHSDNIVRLKRRRDVRPDLLLHVCALDQNNGQQPLALVSWGHSDNIVRLKRRRDVRPDLLLHVCALDQNNGQQPLALVSWGHSDNIVRLKRRRDVRPDLLLHVCALDQITKVVSSCVTAGCPYPLVLGHSSGRVVLVRAREAAGAARVGLRALHAHAAPVAGLHVCARAGLLVTASTDGHIVLWDAYKLIYIRTLPNRDMLSVTHVTISETLCDIASVHDMASAGAADVGGDATPDADDPAEAYEKDAAYKYKSLIRVHTVNARFVGSVKVCERVTCICYSNAPEGVSVNCVAAGLASGGVQLYSSWDLRPLLYIPPPDTRAPLLSSAQRCELRGGRAGERRSAAVLLVGPAAAAVHPAARHQGAAAQVSELHSISSAQRCELRGGRAGERRSAAVLLVGPAAAAVHPAARHQGAAAQVSELHSISSAQRCELRGGRAGERRSAAVLLVGPAAAAVHPAARHQGAAAQVSELHSISSAQRCELRGGRAGERRSAAVLLVGPAAAAVHPAARHQGAAAQVSELHSISSAQRCELRGGRAGERRSAAVLLVGPAAAAVHPAARHQGAAAQVSELHSISSAQRCELRGGRAGERRSAAVLLVGPAAAAVHPAARHQGAAAQVSELHSISSAQRCELRGGRAGERRSAAVLLVGPAAAAVHPAARHQGAAAQVSELHSISSAQRCELRGGRAGERRSAAVLLVGPAAAAVHPAARHQGAAAQVSELHSISSAQRCELRGGRAGERRSAAVLLVGPAAAAVHPAARHQGAAAQHNVVNCVAAGLASGGVRLYSSWDLRPLLYIPPPDTRAPLLSITYSSDSQLLFGCYASGVVVAWESGGATRPAPVRIVPAHALF
ncbi:hypothetical protein PYW07_002510 [Mythimna separata]|uniref:BEACH domain-containing protein n=1 Tax=Mythimna separata TaxID=271217 RepID=A0AAD8DTH5_MYTSE|nr:hypothetical protein PYW07_002510 [Mythimna separata]